MEGRIVGTAGNYLLSQCSKGLRKDKHYYLLRKNLETGDITEQLVASHMQNSIIHGRYLYSLYATGEIIRHSIDDPDGDRHYMSEPMSTSNTKESTVFICPTFMCIWGKYLVVGIGSWCREGKYMYLITDDEIQKVECKASTGVVLAGLLYLGYRDGSICFMDESLEIHETDMRMPIIVQNGTESEFTLYKDGIFLYGKTFYGGYICKWRCSKLVYQHRIKKREGNFH